MRGPSGGVTFPAMLEASFWGLIQGLTEFLPISSSGHLVLVPALLGTEPPDLATSAMLHLGTLLAVLLYFRRDLREMLRFSERGRRLILLLVIGTIPAAVLGLAFQSFFDHLSETPRYVALALIGTGVMLLATRAIVLRSRRVEDSGTRDAAIIGFGQAVALVPGVSRSGATISTGLLRGFDRTEAARYSFLLGIPAIAGAGLLKGIELAGEPGGIGAAVFVGMAVAAVSGYAAIALLLRLIGRIGLVPFGVYCLAMGAFALVVL